MSLRQFGGQNFFNRIQLFLANRPGQNKKTIWSNKTSVQFFLSKIFPPYYIRLLIQRSLHFIYGVETNKQLFIYLYFYLTNRQDWPRAHNKDLLVKNLQEPDSS